MTISILELLCNILSILVLGVVMIVMMMIWHANKVFTSVVATF